LEKVNTMPEPSTHQFVDIKEIRDNVAVLKNGNLRAVLMVSSINFDLLSSEEKEAEIAAFQRFLNSLDFTLQIAIQSRPLDLTEYFGFLKEAQERQDNELLKIQTAEYLDFVKELVTLSNIMMKLFYVVVPYDIAVIKKTGFLEKLTLKKENPQEAETIRFDEAKEKLMLRVGSVMDLLGAMGLKTLPLQNQEMAELFYGLYNPGVALKQQNLELLIATGQEEKQVE